MKKLLAVLLALLMVLCLVGCGNSSEGGADEGSDVVVDETTPMGKAHAAGKLTIANVVNGLLGDKSFFDSGNEFVEEVNEKYSDVAYAETIELTYDKATWGPGIAEVASQGWDIIIAGTYDMKEHVIPLLEEYPNQKWWFYDEEWNFSQPDGWQYAPSDNLYAMMFAQNEGSYVVGYMAAMLSKTGQIAFCGGQDNTVLDDFFVGYAQGAKAYNPDIKVQVGWMDTFSDAAKGKDISSGQYTAGADIVFACGGQAGLGVFDQVITEAEGKYVIGVDGNQGAYFGSLGTDEGNAKAARTITSMQKNVNVGFMDAFQKQLAGTLTYGVNQKLGINGGFVSYSITETTEKLFTADQLAEIKQVSDFLANSAITAGTAFNHEEGWFKAFTEYVK